MFGLLARLLEILYSVWPSFGGAIVLLTLAVMLVLMPLTLKGTYSMLAIQALQPEIKKLQNRYRDDRAKLNEETMKFYQEHKINPLSGCLPLLIQLPVFFILYSVLLGLTRRAPYGQDLGAAVGCHLNGAASTCVNGVYTHAGFFNPKYLEVTSRLGEALASTREMLSWGLDLSQSPLTALGDGMAHALPYIAMVVVVVALTYFQQQQIQSRSPRGSSMQPTQQMMMKVMPVVMGVIYLVIPAGVVIYFLVSSLFRIGQQAIVTRTFAASGLAEKFAAEVEEDLEDAPKPRLRDLFAPQADQAGAARSGSARKATPAPTGSKRVTPSKKATTPAKGSAKSGGRSGGGAGGSSKGAKPTSSKQGAKSGSKAGAKQGSTKSGAKAGSKSSRSSSDGSRGKGRTAVTETTARESGDGATPTSEPATRSARTAPAKAPSRRAPGPGAGSGSGRKKKR